MVRIRAHLDFEVAQIDLLGGTCQAADSNELRALVVFGRWEIAQIEAEAKLPSGVTHTFLDWRTLRRVAHRWRGWALIPRRR
jgi:hypothetical protein